MKVLAVCSLVMTAASGCSRVLITDPPREPATATARPVMVNQDLVVSHFGCGSVDSDDLTAEVDGRDIANAFRFDRGREAWVANDYDLGQQRPQRFSASASVSRPSGCYSAVSGESVRLEIHDYLPTGEFRGLLHDDDDVDVFRLRAPSTGFASLFQITIEATDPSNFVLHTHLRDADDDGLDQARQAAVKYWVALQAGAEVMLKVTASDILPEQPRFLSYRIVVEANPIEDVVEPDDDAGQATELPWLNDQQTETKTAMLCGVVGADGDTVALGDYFSYQHKTCRDECVRISRDAFIEICADGCCDATGQYACLVEHGCNDFITEDTRTILITDPEHWNYFPYGHTEVSATSPPFTCDLFSIHVEDNGPTAAGQCR